MSESTNNGLSGGKVVVLRTGRTDVRAVMVSVTGWWAHSFVLPQLGLFILPSVTTTYLLTSYLIELES